MSAYEQDTPTPDLSRLFLWNMPSGKATHPGFHMPGHAGARLFHDEYASALIAVDTTELASSDDLHDPSGPALRAMQEASRVYGSKESLFVTTGSTTGIHVMLAAVAAPDTFLLLPRTVHLSVLNALSLLDLRYAFIALPQVDKNSVYLYPQLTKDVLAAALERYPQATDVLLVSPDYYGQSADLMELAKLSHNHGCRLLVDEAHGSHFTFAPDLFPDDAMSSHADMCVQSLHKTLPALTMASQIHISREAVASGRISVRRVWEMLRLFETSSPSFVIAASAEYAIAWMESMGSRALSERSGDIRCFLERIQPVLGSQPIMCRDHRSADRMHLVLMTDKHEFSAADLMKALEKKGIDVEFADLLRLVLIISPWHTSKDFDDLVQAISASVEELRLAGKISAQDAFETDRQWGCLLCSIPEKCLPLRTAVFGGLDTDSIELSSAQDRISASIIAPYPPGIAVLWPGEKISAQHLTLLQQLRDLKITVRGMDNGKIDVIHK